MKSVRVGLESLRVLVIANRECHLGEYKEARTGWLCKVANAAESLRAAARDELGVYAGTVAAKEITDKYRTEIASLTPPSSHLEDYDRVISMLEMSVDEIIELSDQEFARYVRDEWDWSRGFKATTSFYSSK